MSKFDNSALTPNEMIYVSALKDDKDAFCENLKNKNAWKVITVVSFNQDPFFKGLRTNPDCVKMIEEILGSDKRET